MTVKILLVEDEVGPTILLQEALRESGIQHVLHIVSDGETAVLHLRTKRFLPHLVLLDLNLPRMSGLEVLQDIKTDPVLRLLPVIILTNSSSQDDIVAAYAGYCNAFIEKSLDFDDLVSTLKATGKFWFEEVTLAALPQ